jgi:hypothetical protein
MELDFDKEIDALLRKESAGRTITIGEFAGGLHLDADEIASFAEKQVPPGVRQAFVEHFAACGKCRKILLDAAWLNAEEEPRAKESIVAPAGATVPWYRRLFLFPNLAYVMGGLVILVAGFIGLSVLTYQTGQSEVSKAVSSEPEYALPSSQPAAVEPFANANSSAVSSANTVSNAANTAANMPYGEAAPLTSANAASNSLVTKQAPVTAPADEDRAKTLQPNAPPPPPSPGKENNFAIDGVAGRPVQEPRTAPAPERDKKAEESKAALADVSAQRSGSMPKLKGPARNDNRERNIALDNETQLSKRKIENLPSASGTAAPAGMKIVRGKTFQFHQGAWYDTTYRGQGTINVRRNTEDYRKLDGGLRGIAESFIGTVVVTIWNGRAYRIQ